MGKAREFYEAATETMDREELERLQLERLKRQVKRCYEGSEFYRQRFSQIGLEPEDIKSLSDFEGIPPVTKGELREEQTNHLPLGRYTIAPPKDWRELHPSTGTTGVPVNTIWTERDIENITEWTARTMWMPGIRPGDIIQNSFAYGLWVAGMSSHYAALPPPRPPARPSSPCPHRRRTACHRRHDAYRSSSHAGYAPAPARCRPRPPDP